MTNLFQGQRSASTDSAFSRQVPSDNDNFKRARRKFQLTVDQPIVIPSRKSTQSMKRRMDDEQNEWQDAVMTDRKVQSKRTSVVETAEEWFVARIYVALLLNSTAYRSLMATVIIMNFLAIIMETNLKAQLEDEEELPAWLFRTTQAFLMMYVSDVVARLFVLRWLYFHSIMNLFDAGIVLLDIVAEVANRVVGDLPSISVLRVLRILRIVRVLRQFLIFRELYLMLQGLVSALRAFVFATIMILVVLINWGILAVELINDTNVELANEGVYGECDRCRRAFHSVQNAVSTFIKTIIAGDSWGQLALPIMERKPWTALIIISALLTVQLGLLNLIVAIIVDRAAQARREDEELMHQLKEEDFANSFDRLLRLFNSMDNDHSGNLTLDEIQMAYETHPEFAAIMKLMDIGRDEMKIAYEIMDHDKSGAVEYKEFVQQLHTMRTYDEHTLLIFVRHNVEVIRTTVDEQHSKISDRLDLHNQLLHEVLDKLGRGPPKPVAGDGEGALNKMAFTEVYRDESPPQEPRAPRVRDSEMVASDKTSARANEMHRDLRRELLRAQRRATTALDALVADFAAAISGPRLLALTGDHPVEPVLSPPQNTSARLGCGAEMARSATVIFPGCQAEMALPGGSAEGSPPDGEREAFGAPKLPNPAQIHISSRSGTPRNAEQHLDEQWRGRRAPEVPTDAPSRYSKVTEERQQRPADARGRYSMTAGGLRWTPMAVPEATLI